MLNPIANAIQDVIDVTWPMVIISIVVAVSLRVAYLIKNRMHCTLYKELFSLIFIIYILCLFQIVSGQDVVSWSTNNFVPFREITRYQLGTSLFFNNVLGNLLLFMPFGFFVSYYLKPKKVYLVFFMTLLTSLAIELVQLYIGRVFDIDDIILNVIGGVFGYIIYYLLDKFASKLPSILKSEVFLDIISIILTIIITVLLITHI